MKKYSKAILSLLAALSLVGSAYAASAHTNSTDPSPVNQVELLVHNDTNYDISPSFVSKLPASIMVAGGFPKVLPKNATTYIYLQQIKSPATSAQVSFKMELPTGSVSTVTLDNRSEPFFPGDPVLDAADESSTSDSQYLVSGGVMGAMYQKVNIQIRPQLTHKNV